MIKSKKLNRFQNINHAFFNRIGGKSTGIFKSLNCGSGSADKKKNILKNLTIVKNITNKIKNDNGGILIIDYAYTDKEMKNTLQAVSKHKYCNILESFGNSDITYNLSFDLIDKMIKKFGTFASLITTQKNFLTKLGIMERAEIVSKNMQFSEKADIYYRIKRLIDEKQMGHLFKVMFITNHKNKFKLGFNDD